MNDSNQSGDTKAATLLGDSAFSGKVAPGVEAVKAQGGQRAFFSVWDLHAYYGESYIVQLVYPWLVKRLSREHRPEAEIVLHNYVEDVFIEGVAH